MDHPETRPGDRRLRGRPPRTRTLSCRAAKCWARSERCAISCAATQPHRIVVGMFERRNRMPVGELLELRFAGNIIEEVATTYERVCGRVCLREIRPSQLIFSGELGPASAKPALSALLQHGSGGGRHLVSFPIMLLTALAVRLSSPGPVLYRQTRVGLDDVAVHRLQIPLHARRCRGRHRRRMGAEGRSARHPRGPHHPRHPLRRVAAALQRAEGRDVDCGPAAGASRVRQEL